MTHFNAAFWRWFGDSKVVDENGDPLVVYHGTSGPLEGNRFDFQRVRATPRFFFTPSKRYAKHYATRSGSPSGQVIPVYLRVENPIPDTKAGHELIRGFIAKARISGRDWPQEALDAGYDGEYLFRGSEIAVFSPTQIKSVYNIGTWDPRDPDIRRNPGRPIRVGAGEYGGEVITGNPPWWRGGDTVTLYHGTSEGLINQIATEGLQPYSPSVAGREIIYQFVPPEYQDEVLARWEAQRQYAYKIGLRTPGGNIYLTPDPGQAVRYANTGYLQGGEERMCAFGLVQVWLAEHGLAAPAYPFEGYGPIVLEMEVPINMIGLSGGDTYPELLIHAKELWKQHVPIPILGDVPGETMEEHYDRRGGGEIETVAVQPLAPSYITKVHRLPLPEDYYLKEGGHYGYPSYREREAVRKAYHRKLAKIFKKPVEWFKNCDVRDYQVRQPKTNRQVLGKLGLEADL